MAELRFYEYAACSTCKKAKKWLQNNKITAKVIPIVESPPTERELEKWMKQSGLPSRRWFNTSGQSYRAMTAELGKDAIAEMSDAEIRKRLAKDGKLIKRPVLVAGDTVLVGFDEETYKKLR